MRTCTQRRKTWLTSGSEALCQPQWLLFCCQKGQGSCKHQHHPGQGPRRGCIKRRNTQEGLTSGSEEARQSRWLLCCCHSGRATCQHSTHPHTDTTLVSWQHASFALKMAIKYHHHTPCVVMIFSAQYNIRGPIADACVHPAQEGGRGSPQAQRQHTSPDDSYFVALQVEDPASTPHIHTPLSGA